MARFLVTKVNGQGQCDQGQGDPDQGQNCRLSKVKNLNMFSSFFARGDFCHLLVTFANSLDPD